MSTLYEGKLGGHQVRYAEGTDSLLRWIGIADQWDDIPTPVPVVGLREGDDTMRRRRKMKNAMYRDLKALRRSNDYAID